MSFQAMTWAVKQKVPTYQKIVLIMLANRTNPETGICYPSLSKIAVECGMTRRSVINQIKALESNNYLSVDRSKSMFDMNHVNKYILNLDYSPSERDSLGSERDSLGSERDSLGSERDSLGSERDSLGGSERDSPNTINSFKQKEKLKDKQNISPTKKTTLPDNFSVSEKVLIWYCSKNYTENIQDHLEAFVDICRANGYRKIDWDATFKNCIRADWAGIRKNNAHASNQRFLTKEQQREAYSKASGETFLDRIRQKQNTFDGEVVHASFGR